MAVGRWRTAVAGVLALTAVVGCGPDDRKGTTGATGSSPSAGQPAGGQASAGAAALGTPASSIEDLARRVQAATGSCSDAKRKSPIDAETLGAALTGGSGAADAADAAKVWLPYVAELATCRASANGQGALYMVRFRPGAFGDFQAAWRDYIRPLKYGQLDVVFGNGFAVHAVNDTQPTVIARLGLKYLRCQPVEELNAQKIPSDVDGCVFSNTPGQ